MTNTFKVIFVLYEVVTAFKMPRNEFKWRVDFNDLPSDGYATTIASFSAWRIQEQFMSMERSPDSNMEKGAKQIPCRNCSGEGYKKKFDDKGIPMGKETCKTCNGSGFTRS